LKLDNIKCDSCANKAKNQLETAPFVHSATVQHVKDTTTGLAVVYLTTPGVIQSELSGLLKEASISSVYERTLFSNSTFNGTKIVGLPCVFFSVSGMGCGGCVMTINEHLIKIPGIYYVTTSLLNHTTELCGYAAQKGLTLPKLPEKFTLQELEC